MTTEVQDSRFDPVMGVARHHLRCDSAGVAVRGDEGAALTLAASDPTVSAADEWQTRHADGPAVSPAWPKAQILVADVSGASPWPVWTRALAEAGIRAVLATQIVTAPGVTGSLTLYYRRPVFFAAEHLALATMLARQVGEDLDHAHEVAGLRTAIEGRTVIGQAQGLLMERFGLDADRAFAVLRRHSQDGNVRLRQVAEDLLSTGRLPSVTAAE